MSLHRLVLTTQKLDGITGRGASRAGTLVFLEHHEGEIVRNALGVLSKAAGLGGEVAGVVAGSGVRELAAQAGEYGASPRLRGRRPGARGAAAAAARRRARARSSPSKGFDTVLFGQSVLAADLAAGLAARLDAGLNWDLTDIALEDGKLVGKRPALADSVVVDVGWTSEPRLALFRTGCLRPGADGRQRRGRGRRRRARRSTRPAR